MVFGQELTKHTSIEKVIVALCEVCDFTVHHWMLKIKPSTTVRAFFFGLSDKQIGEQLVELDRNGRVSAALPRNIAILKDNFQELRLVEQRETVEHLKCEDLIRTEPIKPEVKPEPVEVKAEPEQEVKETEVTEQKIEDPDDEIDVMAIIEPLIANRKGMKAVNTAIVIKAVIDEDYELAREYLDRIIK